MPENVHPFDDELIAVLFNEVPPEKVQSALGRVWFKPESLTIRFLGLNQVLVVIFLHPREHVRFISSCPLH
jgi:hypothetical protein